MPRAPDAPSQLPRLTSWWLIALALSVLVFLLAPQQIPVSLYKVNLIALAAVAGYWIDRKVFPYARPIAEVPRALALFAAWHYGRLNKPDDEGFAFVPGMGQVHVHQVPLNLPPLALIAFALGCMLRRAVIMAAAMLAIGLGA